MINIKRLPLLIILLVCFFYKNNVYGQKVNQFDANKKRTGVWKKFYDNNTIRYEGAFKNGKEIGEFKFYRQGFPNYPSIIKKYKTTTDTVTVAFYSTKAKLESKGYFIGKTRVGAWKYFFKNGKLMSEEFYHNGKLSGKLVNYYPNGKITEETFYKNGLKDGLSKKYSSDGVLIEEVTYSNDKPNGLAKYFELNGNLKEKGMYKNGRRIGKWEFYLDGEVADDEELKKKKKYIKNE